MKKQTSFAKFDDVSLSEACLVHTRFEKTHKVLYAKEETKLRLSFFEHNAIPEIDSA